MQENTLGKTRTALDGRAVEDIPDIRYDTAVLVAIRYKLLL